MPPSGPEHQAPVRQRLQRLVDELLLRSPQLAALRPLHVIAWSVVASAVAASLPHAIPAAPSHPPDTFAIMAVAFVGCLIMAGWWLFAQARERQSAPRWIRMGWAWSPGAAAVAVFIVFAPTYVAGCTSDRIVRSLRTEAELREDIARILSRGCPLDYAASLRPDPRVGDIAQAMCWEVAGGGPLARCAAPGSPTRAQIYGVNLALAPTPKSESDCLQIAMSNGFAPPDGKTLQPPMYGPAVERLFVLARAHDLVSTSNVVPLVPDWPPSRDPNLGLLLLFTVALTALLASLSAIIAARRVAGVVATLTSIVIAVQEVVDAGAVWSGSQPRTIHMGAVVWEGVAWIAYCGMFAKMIHALRFGPRARRGMTDTLMGVLVLFPLFVLGVHVALARNDFVLVPGRLAPTFSGWIKPFPALAGHGYAYALVLGTLVAQTLLFPLWSRYRRLPDAC